jgi:SAM-dependent methyltransferase
MSQAIFWNERYQSDTYAYGEEPNVYFKQCLEELTPGKILLPLEGEGRNAVYAAECGWEVYAFDFSEAGRRKALALADAKGVSIQYDITDVNVYEPTSDFFEVIGLFFAHFPADFRSALHQKLLNGLKPGGRLFLEGFSREHRDYQKINPRSGGPQDIEMLFSVELIENDFTEMVALEVQQVERELREGQYHQGMASLIQFKGQKRL